MELPPEWLNKFYDFTYFGALGGFSALVGYFVKVVRNDDVELQWSVAAITLVVGLYLGMLFGGLMPDEWGDKRDAVMLMIGVSGIKGFELVSSLALDKIRSLLK